MRRILLSAVVVAWMAPMALAQGGGVSWQRSAPATTPELKLFHSTHAISLPTAEVLNAGEFQFEISHRFIPPVSDGYDALYGLDGPVNMRIGLGYAPVNGLFLVIARSNLTDNTDLQAKWQVLEVPGESLPFILAVQAGGAWNTAKRADRDRGDARNFQGYAQLIINTMIRKRLAIGAVPSVVRNSDINSPDTENLFALGLYGQVYVNRLLSLVAEWTPDLGGEGAPEQAAAFGFELETGGHFFKIFATNSVEINPSQYLVGTAQDFNPDNWRLGFMITRLLIL
ncbi:MAG: hypothetical protein Kow0074_08390 [Candidatus Zixiibacteriota bacterium]